jgi:hypothetical protein
MTTPWAFKTSRLQESHGSATQVRSVDKTLPQSKFAQVLFNKPGGGRQTRGRKPLLQQLGFPAPHLMNASGLLAPLHIEGGIMFPWASWKMGAHCLHRSAEHVAAPLQDAMLQGKAEQSRGASPLFAQQFAVPTQG